MFQERNLLHVWNDWNQAAFRISYLIFDILSFIVIAKASEIHSLVEDTYNFLDVNNDGSLRESEIATALKKLNTYPSKVREKVFGSFCQNNSKRDLHLIFLWWVSYGKGGLRSMAN